jgi:putative transposase
MPFLRLYYHLVWSTKKRLPLINEEDECGLYNYLASKASQMECRVLAVNGCSDHIHLVIEIPPKMALAEVVQRLKGASSHDFPDLIWQRGYGALTISEWNLERVVGYVKNQKIHHRDRTVMDMYEPGGV